MPEICVQRQHDLGLQAIREAAERIAGELDQTHGIQYYWKGNTLHFARTGVSGEIRTSAQEISVEVSLGLMLLPMAGFLEQEIERHLDTITGTSRG